MVRFIDRTRSIQPNRLRDIITMRTLVIPYVLIFLMYLLVISNVISHVSSVMAFFVQNVFRITLVMCSRVKSLAVVAKIACIVTNILVMSTFIEREEPENASSKVTRDVIFYVMWL